MPKKITIDELARMVQEGFAHQEAKFKSEMDTRFGLVNDRFDGVDKRLDGIDERLDTMEVRLSRIEHSILIDHRDRIERLEDHAFGKYSK